MGFGCAPTFSGILVRMIESWCSRGLACSWLDLRPQRQKARAVHPVGKTRRQQRRVVVAKLGTEEGELARQTALANRERQQRQHRPTCVIGNDNRRPHAVAGADMALPGREPIEGLKNRAVGMLEGAPVPLDRRQVLEDGNADTAKAAPPARAPRRGPRPAGRRRNARRVVLGQPGPWPRLAMEALEMGLRPRDVHNPLTRPPRSKSRSGSDVARGWAIPIVRAVPVGAWRSPVSALVWGTRGRWFKSSRPDQYLPLKLNSLKAQGYVIGQTGNAKSTLWLRFKRPQQRIQLVLRSPSRLT